MGVNDIECLWCPQACLAAVVAVTTAYAAYRLLPSGRAIRQQNQSAGWSERNHGHHEAPHQADLEGWTGNIYIFSIPRHLQRVLKFL